jgi:hypothetical protein
VAFPPLPPRVEEKRDPALQWIESTEVARFREIAVVARPGEIVKRVLTAVLPGDNVFEVEWKQREVVFAQAAILTALCGAGTDKRSRRAFHVA